MKQHDLRQRPGTDPTTIYRNRDGLYAADLLAAAIVHLDFFSRLSRHPSDLAGICRDFGIKERPADVMLTLFVAMGLVKRRRGIFTLTRLAREHLVRESPWFIGAYFASLKERPVCKDMLKVLKSDRPANWGSIQNEKEWAKSMEDPVFASQFTAAMDSRGVYLGQVVARVLKLRGRRALLDIAGGSGIYSCCIVARHPRLTATVLEKPPVDKVARDSIVKRGFRNRVSVFSGDMFKDPWPTGFDVHLISNVLHDWDVPVVKQILAASHEALAGGGLLVIHDAHINADKSGPIHVAEYSAMLMHSTEGKCYSIGEMKNFLVEAGFEGVKFIPTAAGRSLIVATRQS
ncbi:MAG TPA: methyltransferase [Candidatus Nitrosotalea sp.]|nr:methyltransferase [Candidatus Nitrosotalea sp.]